MAATPKKAAPAAVKKSDGLVHLVSPWGGKVTVSEDTNLEDFLNLGYKKSR